MKRSHIFLILALLVTVFIFSSSMQTATESDHTSGQLLAIINKLLSCISVTLSHTFIRKLAHFTEFFVQGVFLSLAAVYSRKGMKHYLFRIAGAGLLTACADEFLQNFFDGRSCQLTDVLIDFGGTSFAILAVFLIFSLMRRCRDV